jgi:hypothetical protein
VHHTVGFAKGGRTNTYFHPEKMPRNGDENE